MQKRKEGKMKMILNQTSSFILSLQAPVILPARSKLCEDWSSSKDRVFIEDDLRRIPRHFDKLSVTEKK